MMTILIWKPLELDTIWWFQYWVGINGRWKFWLSIRWWCHYWDSFIWGPSFDLVLAGGASINLAKAGGASMELALSCCCTIKLMVPWTGLIWLVLLDAARTELIHIEGLQWLHYSIGTHKRANYCSELHKYDTTPYAISLGHSDEMLRFRFRWRP